LIYIVIIVQSACKSPVSLL